MKKLILGLIVCLSSFSAIGSEQYSFTAAVPAGVSMTLLNYLPSPFYSTGLSVEVRGCNATVTNVYTMTAGIGYAGLDYADSDGPITKWVTRSGAERTFLAVQATVSNTYPAYCTYVFRPLN